MARQVKSEAGDTLDLLCWRLLGSTVPVEAVYEANPGLAGLGAALPIGTPIILPEATITTATATAPASAPMRETVQLWS